MTGKNLLAPVPFCYAIEYKQKHGVTATNMTNNIVAISNTVSNIGQNVMTQNMYNGLTGAFDKIKDTISSALSSVVNSENAIVSSIGTGIKKITDTIGGITGDTSQEAWKHNGHLNTELLSPYFYLYSLKETGK
jgi:hypothetical protein